MLEKLALFRIAFCNAPVLSRAAARRISVTTSTVPAAPSSKTGSGYWVDMTDLRHQTRGRHWATSSLVHEARQPHSLLRSLCVLKRSGKSFSSFSPGRDDHIWSSDFLRSVLGKLAHARC